MLENLKLLKDDMINKKWTICSFIFVYKEIEYIVLVKRFVGKEKRIDKYALVKLHFMKSNDLKDSLQVEANSKRLIMDAKDLRDFFNIEYSVNLCDILGQFTNGLGKAIPMYTPSEVSGIGKTAMVISLSKSDSEDPNKIYCTNVKRNFKGNKRSDFNADKTKLLRRSLFENFKNDESISFCYSDDRTKEKDDSEILKKFAINSTK